MTASRMTVSMALLDPSAYGVRMTAKKEMPDQVGHDKTLNCFLFYFPYNFGVCG